jgi:predicted GIY-YIG superfamily endonuclease
MSTNDEIVLKWEDYSVNEQMVNSEILSDEDIQECLYRATEDEWIQIYKNRFAFPNNVRYVVESIDLLRERRPVGKLQFRAMTESEWAMRNNAEETELRKEQAKAFAEAWEIEQQRIHDGLLAGIDKDIKLYIGIVSTAKERLNHHLSLKVRRYTPPSRRGNVDSVQEKLEKELAAAENELEHLQQKVVSSNFYSLAARKNAFQKEWMSLMQKKAASLIDL